MRPEVPAPLAETLPWHQNHEAGLIQTELRKSGKPQNWKNGVVEVGEKKWNLEAKNGLPEFFVGWKLMFWGRSLIWKGQKNGLEAENGLREFFVGWKWKFLMRTLIWRGRKNEILAKKGRKWPKRFFEKFWVEPGNLSNLANWIKNQCFLYGFL